MPGSLQVIRPLPPPQILPQHCSDETRLSLLQPVCGRDERAQRVIGAVAALPNSRPRAWGGEAAARVQGVPEAGATREAERILGPEGRRALGDGARPVAGMRGEGPKGVCQAGGPSLCRLPLSPALAQGLLRAPLLPWARLGHGPHHMWHLRRFTVSLL